MSGRLCVGVDGVLVKRVGLSGVICCLKGVQECNGARNGVDGEGSGGTGRLALMDCCRGGLVGRRLEVLRDVEDVCEGGA